VRALVTAGLALAGALLLAGCTGSSSTGTPPGPPVPTTTSGPSTPVTSPPVTSGPPSSPSVPATPSTTPSATKSTPAPTKGTAPPGPRECGVSDVSLRVLKGGAVVNAEIALLTFTNTSKTVCAMTGFPGVSLRLGNAALGAPATRTTKAPTTVVLAPGAAASTTLSDVSTCQAALSDTVRVYPPDSTAFIDKPLVLRGCTLHIDPVAPAV
jgi:hypothetical protein